MLELVLLSTSSILRKQTETKRLLQLLYSTSEFWGFSLVTLFFVMFYSFSLNFIRHFVVSCYASSLR